MKHKGLNQLVCAALVNGRFCETLLHDPARAMAGGYLGHTFSLTSEERDLVLDINAQRLEDFASQVHHWISGNGNGHNGNGHNGNGYNGNGHNGNGRNGNGHGKGYEPLEVGERFVELHRAWAVAQ